MLHSLYRKALQNWYVENCILWFQLTERETGKKCIPKYSWLVNGASDKFCTSLCICSQSWTLTRCTKTFKYGGGGGGEEGGGAETTLFVRSDKII